MRLPNSIIGWGCALGLASVLTLGAASAHAFEYEEALVGTRAPRLDSGSASSFEQLFERHLLGFKLEERTNRSLWYRNKVISEVTTLESSLSGSLFDEGNRAYIRGYSIDPTVSGDPEIDITKGYFGGATYVRVRDFLIEMFSYDLVLAIDEEDSDIRTINTVYVKIYGDRSCLQNANTVPEADSAASFMLAYDVFFIDGYLRKNHVQNRSYGPIKFPKTARDVDYLNVNFCITDMYLAGHEPVRENN